MEENKMEVTCGTEHAKEGLCCHQKATPREEKGIKLLKNRLSRMTGQLNGIAKMLDENRYCGDILIQVAAVNAALNSFNKVLLANHIRTCVMRDIQAGKEETIDELVMTLQKLMK